MSGLAREVLKGNISHRKKGTTSQWKGRWAVAFCGGGGSAAQIELTDDGEQDGGGTRGKGKRVIVLSDAKVDALSPPSTPNESSPHGSVTGTSPRTVGSPPSSGSKNEFHVTTGGETHEFKCESDEDKSAWVKLLGLLVLFPTASIPQEPRDNPVKESFRSKLSAKDFKADSVWAVYILAEEVSTKLSTIGVHILVLRGGVPNQSMGTLEIVSPTETSTPVVSWERDKLRRTGKTGNLVFVEIGRRCKGGPGLVWFYPGPEQAQALRETLHNFLFHGDGKAIGISVQQSVPCHEQSKPSVDSLPPSYNRRSSASSGYHSLRHSIEHNVTSPTSGYGSPTMQQHSELVGPAVHLDQHPGRIPRQTSAPCAISNSVLLRRSSGGLQTNVVPHRGGGGGGGGGEHIYNTPRSCLSSAEDQAFFESFENLLHHPDEDPGSYPAGQLDSDCLDRSHRRSATVMTSGLSSNRTQLPPRSNTVTTSNVSRNDEYEIMIHPGQFQRSLSKDSDYVSMSSAPPDGHAQSPLSRSYANYDQVPSHRTNGQSKDESLQSKVYENHPMPLELQNVVPVCFQPTYENVETARKSKVGSLHTDQYENVLANGDQLPGFSRTTPSGVYENVNVLSPSGVYYAQLKAPDQASHSVQPSIKRVDYDTVDLKMTNGLLKLSSEQALLRASRS